MVHSVHCMMGLDSPHSTGEEMTVEEQVERLFVVTQLFVLLFINEVLL